MGGWQGTQRWMDPAGLFPISGPGCISCSFCASRRGCWEGQAGSGAGSRAGFACGAALVGSAPEWHWDPLPGILLYQGQTWPWSLGTVPVDLLMAWLQLIAFCGVFERWDRFG